MNIIIGPAATAPHPEIAVFDKTDRCIQDLLHKEWYLSAWSTLSTAIQWWMSHRSGSLETICFHLISFPDSYLKYKQQECLELFARVQPYLGDQCKQALITKEGSFSAAIPSKPPSIHLENFDSQGIDTSLCKFAQAVQLAKKTGQNLDGNYALLQNASDKAAQFAVCDFWKNHFSARLSIITGVKSEAAAQASFTPFPAFLKACRKIQKSLIQFSGSEKSHTLNLEISRRLLALEHPPHLSIQRYHGALEDLRTAFKGNVRPVRERQADRFARFQQFFTLMLNEAVEILGKPPCPFDFRCIGSWGKEEGLPRSDLEFFILIQEQEHSLYFLHLTKLLDVQFKSLGESDHTSFNLGFENGMVLDNGGSDCVGSVEAFVKIQKNISPEDFANSEARMVLTSLSLFCHPEGHGLFTTFVEKIEAIPAETRQRKALACIQSSLIEYRQHWNQSFEKILQQPITLKEKFQKFLPYILSDLALYFGIRHTNTLDIIDALVRLGKLSADSGVLLRTAQEKLYALCVRLNLLEKPLGPKIPLSLESLPQEEQRSLASIYCFVIRPLYAYIDEHVGSAEFFQTPLDLAPLAVKMWREESLESWDLFFDLPITNHRDVYQALSTRNLSEDVRKRYIEILRQRHNALVDELAQIPTRSGYRQAMRLDEERLSLSLAEMTTDNPASGVKIRCPLLDKERYLTPDAAKSLLKNGHIEKVYPNSLHNVNHYGPLHFKELPYQPLMEYAIHSLTYRIMGKATPPTTLARFEVDGVSYPVLISETIVGKKLEAEEYLNLSHLTGLRLCEILIKPGDGRLSNYVVSNQKIYCIDNDISFMEPIVRELVMRRRVTFCSALFTLDYPLDPHALTHFCSLEPDLILTAWLEELALREKTYLDLFSEAEQARFYAQDKERRFSPSLLLARGSIATLCLQFYKLQDALRAHAVEDPLFLLHELISLHESETNPVGPLVKRQYRDALKAPFAKRLGLATSSKADRSITPAEAMRINYKTIPTFEEVQGKGVYSLQEAIKELCVTEALKLWNQVFITQIAQEYALEADFSSTQDLERQKLMLKALKHLYDAKKQKPRSLTLRYAATLDFDTLKNLLHPGLRNLDLSYCPNVTGGVLFNDSLSLIMQTCPNLKSLHLEGCSGIVNFSTSHPTLRLANLSYCPNLTTLKLDTLQLQELRISHCPKLTTADFPFKPGLKVDWKESPHIKNPSFKIFSALYDFGDSDYFYWPDSSLGAAGSFALAEILKTNTSLTRIALGSNTIGDNEITALAEAFKVNTTLKSVELGNNKIGDAGAIALAGALEVNRSITSMNLRSNKIGPQGARAIAGALMHNASLTHLNLSFNKIDDDGAYVLADALRTHTSLVEFHLQGNDIGDAGTSALAKSLAVNTSIRHFSLGGKLLGDVGITALGSAFRVNRSLISFELSIIKTNIAPLAESLSFHNNTIKKLEIRWADMNEKSVEALATALKSNRSITRLKLDFDHLGDAKVKTMVEGLAINTSIRVIDLSVNDITDEGASQIASCLKANSTIIKIDLSNNNIGPRGASALAEALMSNRSLSEIKLGYNKIGAEGTFVLFDALKANTSLTSLDLTRTSKIHASALSEALKVNSSITSLSLDYGKIGDVGATLLAEAMEINTSVSYIGLLGNTVSSELENAIQTATHRNRERYSLAFTQARASDPQLIKTLESGLSLYETQDGYTLLHVAAAYGHLDLVRMLLERSTNPTFKDWEVDPIFNETNTFKTALDFAKEYNHPEVVELLTNWKSKP